jgi:hypothetical protein
MGYNYGSPITGTLTGTTATVAVPVSAVVYPATIVLNSADGGRAIQLSFDNGATFYTAVTPTGTETGQIYYVLNFPVTTIKFTGAAADTYSIL